jgi:hypothetical protein
MAEELCRQNRQLCWASSNMDHVQHVSDQTYQTLKRMSCGGKVFNLSNIKTTKPEVLVRNNGNNGYKDTSSLIRLSATPSPQTTNSPESKQQQIKDGIGNLHVAMDVITLQQRDMAETLRCQDGRLALFEDKVDTAINKIKRNSQVVNNIKANK